MASNTRRVTSIKPAGVVFALSRCTSFEEPCNHLKRRAEIMISWSHPTRRKNASAAPNLHQQAFLSNGAGELFWV